MTARPLFLHAPTRVAVMNKFPIDVDINVLDDHTLEMICFNANQIYFHFDGHISIIAD